MMIREQIFTNFPEGQIEMLLLSSCMYRMGNFKDYEWPKVREEAGVAEKTGFV